MSESRQPDSTSDALIDEVRAVRREICARFGNDVDRLCDHLREVERDYAARHGDYADVSKQTAANVIDSWGEDPYRSDDPIVDEVRAIRRQIASERKLK